MKNIDKTKFYIGAIMITMMLCCFGLINILADPTEGPATAETASAPGTTEVASTDTGIGTSETEAITTEIISEVPYTRTKRYTPTPTPVPKTSDKRTIKTANNVTQTETTAKPIVTTSKPTQITYSIDPNQGLPTFSPDIKSKSEIYNTMTLEEDIHGYNIYIATTWEASEDRELHKDEIALFEEKYNCKVVFLNFTKDVIYNLLLKSCSNGVTYFDAILMDSATLLVDYEPLGLLEEFNKYLTQAEIDKIPESYKRFLGKGENVYGIPAHAPDLSCIWANSSLVKRYDLKDPVGYYNKNNWTWNIFNDVLYDAIGDKDNDPEKKFDLYGLATSSNVYSPIIEASGGGVYRWIGEKFISGITNKASISGLTFVRNLYTNFYFASGYESYFYLEKAAYLAGETSMGSEIKRYLAKSELSLLPYPTNAMAGKYMTTATYADCAAIIKTSRYPAHTAEVLKILYGGDNFTKRVDKFCSDNKFTSQNKSVYLKMLDNFTMDFTSAFDKENKMGTSILSHLKNGTFSSDVANSKLNPEIEALIEQRTKKIDLASIPTQIIW